MIVKKFIKNPLNNNNYVVIDEVSKEALLVDCSEPCDDIIDYINNYGAKLKYILLTHAHFDHILGVEYVREKTKALSCLYQDDKDVLDSVSMFVDGAKPPVIDIFFDDAKSFYLGDIEIKVLHTSGHSKGSVCYLIKDYLFSGDTLFYGTYGRTDLPTGSNQEMFKSLQKIFLLPDDVKVYPGHGKDTLIEKEKKHYIFE